MPCSKKPDGTGGPHLPSVGGLTAGAVSSIMPPDLRLKAMDWLSRIARRNDKARGQTCVRLRTRETSHVRDDVHLSHHPNCRRSDRREYLRQDHAIYPRTCCTTRLSAPWGEPSAASFSKAWVRLTSGRGLEIGAIILQAAIGAVSGAILTVFASLFMHPIDY